MSVSTFFNEDIESPAELFLSRVTELLDLQLIVALCGALTQGDFL